MLPKYTDRNQPVKQANSRIALLISRRISRISYFRSFWPFSDSCRIGPFRVSADADSERAPGGSLFGPHLWSSGRNPHIVRCVSSSIHRSKPPPRGGEGGGGVWVWVSPCCQATPTPGRRLQRRLPAAGTAVGRQCLAGTNRLGGRWGRAEGVGRTDRHPRRGRGGGPPPGSP